MKIKKKEGSYNEYVCDLSYSELVEIEKAMAQGHTGPVADELYGGLRYFLDRLPKPGEEPNEGEEGADDLGEKPGGFDLGEFKDDLNGDLPGEAPVAPGGEGGPDPTLQELGIDDPESQASPGPEVGEGGGPEGPGHDPGAFGDEDIDAAADSMLDEPPADEPGSEPARPPKKKEEDEE